MADVKIQGSKFKVFILPVLAVGIGIALTALWIVPQAFGVVKTNEDINKAESLNKKLETKAAQLQTIDQQKTTYKDNITTAGIAVPPEREIPSAFGQIDTVLKQTGVTLISINFGPPVDAKSKTQFYLIRIDIQGQSETVKAMIDQLKTTPRIFKVDGVSLVKSRTSEDLEGSISLRAFFQKLPTQIGTVDQAVVLPTTADLEALEQIKQRIKTSSQSGTIEVSGPVGKDNPFQ